MTPGAQVRWYDVHGWRYGILVNCYRVWATVHARGRDIQVKAERLQRVSGAS